MTQYTVSSRTVFEALTGTAAHAVLVSAPLLGATPSLAVAQTTGPITETVTNADAGAPLSGVAVDVYNVSGTGAGAGVTDAAGSYSVSSLPAGTYCLRTFHTLGYVDEL